LMLMFDGDGLLTKHASKIQEFGSGCSVGEKGTRMWKTPPVTLIHNIDPKWLHCNEWCSRFLIRKRISRIRVN